MFWSLSESWLGWNEGRVWTTLWKPLVKVIWRLQAASLFATEKFSLRFLCLYHDYRLVFNFLFLVSPDLFSDLHN